MGSHIIIRPLTDPCFCDTTVFRKGGGFETLRGDQLIFDDLLPELGLQVVALFPQPGSGEG